MSPEETRVRLTLLREAIRSELVAIEELTVEAAELVEQSSPGRHHVRALGSVLHDYYSAIEKLLKRIVDTLDGTAPSGTGWHQQLLDQASLPIPQRRPAILDADVTDRLRELLGFRHVFRNVYGSRLSWDRLVALGRQLAEVHPRLRAALGRFAEYLEQVAQGL